MGKAVRLDKFLADAGVGTRSEVKKYIQKGKVQVNGVPAKKPEIKVSEEDEVILDGNRVSKAPEFVYYLLYKPAGYISATEDKRDRTVMELVPSDRKDMFPVGRLDKDTEGLLLLTNDGELAHRLLSPKKHVDKTYYARIDGKVDEEDQRAFLQGVDIGDETKTAPAKLEILKSADISEILLTIQEGRFHQVKRMFQVRDKQVIYLKRMTMGPLVLGDDLPKGNYRELCEEERKALERV